MFRIKKNQNRSGVAVTECALVAPMIIAFTLFTIEICTVMFLRESLTIAAYEGARVGIQRGNTNDMVTFRIEEFLDDRGIAYGATPVTFSNPGFDSALELEHVTTTVTVPSAGNLPFGWFFTGSEVSAQVTMRKEFTNPPEDD